jgi:UDP-N-acetylglucosamine 2-epimerase (non-hydrolysing)
MIDSLLKHLPRANQSPIRKNLNLHDEEYAVLTLHRPSNVDDPETFRRILDALEKIGQRIRIVFPIHPRTLKMVESSGLGNRVRNAQGLLLTGPLGYLDFLNLYSGARLVLTDSGGIQEETSVLGIPCLTLRENTERPITVTMGTNTIVGTDPDRIVAAALATLENTSPAAPTKTTNIPLWDGRAAERILAELS